MRALARKEMICDEVDQSCYYILETMFDDEEMFFYVRFSSGNFGKDHLSHKLIPRDNPVFAKKEVAEKFYCKKIKEKLN